MALTNSKAFRNGRKQGNSLKGYFHLIYTVIAATYRPHNLGKEIPSCVLWAVKSIMVDNFRRYRKMIRHDGYRPTDIADMIIQKGGAI